MHGPNKRRGKKSEYAIQLAEKQKAKYTYGILEKQFSNMFKKASAKSGISGVILLQLCEQRLDNVVFRLGISPTRRGARQLVSHRHITVNGSIVNIPSYSLKVGDVVGVREKSKSMIIISSSLSSENAVHEWLLWDNNSLTGEVKAIPTREQISENIKEQLIVELYSK
jgi:small subunit ribosomal protein S4